MFRRLSDWLSLTNTERKVILFLSGTLLIGAGIRLYQETFPSLRQFDYRASDSTFAALSEAALEDSTSAEDEAGPDSVLVNINTSSKQELMDLPGIGAVTAGRIIGYRTETGPFRTVDDLLKVKGISKRKLEQLKPFITVQEQPVSQTTHKRP
jgi:competence protein ComEA